MPKERCSIKDCFRQRKYKEVCGTHYERHRLHGSYDVPPKPTIRIPIENRFWSHVEKTQQCWYWTGFIDKDGYGRTTVEGVSVAAHLVACQLVGRFCPSGLVSDHVCHTEDGGCPGGPCPHRKCVNPDHIKFISRVENAKLGHGPSMTAYKNGTCMRGHTRTDENTYFRKDRPGKRECKDCMKLRKIV